MVTWQSCTTEGAYTKQQQLGCKMNAGKQRKALAPDSTTDKSNGYGYIQFNTQGRALFLHRNMSGFILPAAVALCPNSWLEQGSAPPPVLHQVHLQTSAFWCTCINQQVLYYWFKIKCSDLSDTGLIVFPWNNEVWEQIAVCRLHMRTWLFTENWECLEVAVVILPDINKSELEMPWRGEH